MIQPVTEQVINEQSGVLRSGKAHIKAKNLHVILEFLRNKCYSDIPRAIVREYGTNGQDIHNRHQITKPIVVTLPSLLDSFFKVRDFGPALSDDQIEDMFLSYGESDKRNTNAETGSLGLGCKCGFAYGDSFIINAYQNGQLSVWNAYIDPSKEGKIDQMAAKVPTTEPDGLEIVIPIRQEDIDTFRSKAIEVYAYFNTVPTLINIQPHEESRLKEIREKKAVAEGKGWKFFGQRSGRSSLAIMANVAYGLSSKAFTAAELDSETRQLIDSGIEISFENGELDFAISREELQYTDRTKKNIIARVQSIADEIVANVEAQFAGAKTLWDAKLLWQEIFRMDGALYAVQSLFSRKVKWNGKPINGSAIPLDSSKGYMVYYSISRNEVKKFPCSEIAVSKDHLVVVNNTSINNGIVNRVIGQLWNEWPHTAKYRKVYVITFNHGQMSEDAWRKETGFDSDLASLATLPKEPLSKYYGANGNGGRTFSPKHTSREFAFVRQPKTQQKASDWWEVEDVDLANDAGVYVALERFEYFDRSNYQKDPSDLEDLLRWIAALGIQLPKILGFKNSSRMKAEKNPKMVTFWKWLDKAIADFCVANPALCQDFINRRYVLDNINRQHEHLGELGKVVSKWSSVPANSQLIQFFQKVQALAKYDENKMSLLNRALNYTQHKITGKPTHEVMAEYDKLSKRYPLLFSVAKKVGSYYVSTSEWNKPLEEYVVMTDLVSP